MATQMKVIQAGVGGFGKQWVKTLAADRAVKVVGLVDLKEDALEAACALGGHTKDICFGSLKEALGKVAADAVVCVTPPEHHRRVVVEALRTGLDAISEKPMAGTMADCKAMLRTARETGRTYAVSQNYRYMPAMWTVADLIRRGRIGEVGQVTIDFFKGVRFGGFRSRMDYPLLIDMSIHHFDLIRFLTGLDPLSVHGVSWNPAWSHYAGDASSSVLFEMANGARVIYNGSWCAKGDYCDWAGNWRIEGSKGTILYRNGNLRLVKAALYKQDTDEPVAVKDRPRTPQASVLHDFMRARRNGRPAQTDVADNIKSVAMVFAAVQAVKSGRRVPVLDKGLRTLLAG